MNKTFIICCTEQTAQELKERGIENKDGLRVVNNHDDLAKQIKRTCGACSIFLEDMYKEAKVGDDNHINEISLRISKIKPQASLFVLEASSIPRSPHVFKGSLSQDGLINLIGQ